MVFLIFIMSRGYFSGFYPYPFLNVSEIGYDKTFLNIGVVFGTILIMLVSLLFLGKLIVKKKSKI